MKLVILSLETKPSLGYRARIKLKPHWLVRTDGWFWYLPTGTSIDPKLSAKMEDVLNQALVSASRRAEARSWEASDFLPEKLN